MTKPFFTEADCDCERSYIVDPHIRKRYVPSISLARANALLAERGKVVYGPLRGPWITDAWTSDKSHEEAEQTALLICIESIEQDSAEKILSDLISHDGASREKLCELISRARKLLGGEK